MRYFDRAALFVEACLQYGAFELNDDTNILFLKSCFCICVLLQWVCMSQCCMN